MSHGEISPRAPRTQRAVYVAPLGLYMLMLAMAFSAAETVYSNHHVRNEPGKWYVLVLRLHI
jgi:hypothetical protein